ncbi:MAG: hypothetical protein ABEI86_09040, partial [Halobacteriaceae archaeon]
TGNRDDGSVKDWNIIRQKGDSVILEDDDGNVRSLNVGSSNNELLFLGLEDWYSRSIDKKWEDIRTHLDQIESPFSDSYDNEINAELEKFFGRFNSIEHSKYVASSLREKKEYTGNTGVASTTNYGATKRYILKYRKSNTPRTFIHEATHGFHLSHGYYKEEYADMPDSDKIYPEFNFEKDGTSLSGLGDMDNHLLRHDDYGIPGRDKKGEVYDIVYGNFNLDFDTSVSESRYFDPDDHDAKVGDIVKIDTGDSTVNYEITREAPIKGIRDNEWVFPARKIRSDDETNILVDSDGNIKDYDLVGVDTGGIDDSLPVGDYEDPVYQLIEATNLVWMEKVFTLTKWKEDNLVDPESPVNELNHFWRPYDVRNPNEILTNLIEVMMSEYPYNENNFATAKDALKVKRKYSELFDAYLDIWEPSPEVKDVLDQQGIDY